MPNDEANKETQLDLAIATLNIRTTDRSSLHKQSRGYLKTAGRLVGRDRQEGKNLFTLPTYDSDTRAYKEVLSRNTAILGNLLFNLWQGRKDNEGIYSITNLSSLAELMQTSPQELKLYLICLGGYQYPVTRRFKDKRGVKMRSDTMDKIFSVEFIHRDDGEADNIITNDDRVGTGWVSFIKGRDIESIKIKPSQSFIEDMGGKGLGYVLVSDEITAYSLGLETDLAYKIFSFSGSNKPAYTIGFEKLIKNLNLEKQVKGQGKPRVLKRIKEALDELKAKGHLTSWEYDEQKKLFKWTYSNKIIKHSLLTAPKTPPEQQDKTGQNTPKQDGAGG